MACLCCWIESNRAWYPVGLVVVYSTFVKAQFDIELDPSPQQEASVFFKKRAVLEEEYGKSLQKLARSTSEVYSMNDGKAGYRTTHFDH